MCLFAGQGYEEVARLLTDGTSGYASLAPAMERSDDGGDLEKG
jgi:hypothetical protein